MTKRLVFCFDGTWNRLDAPEPTNVVMTAESVTPTANDGTAQLIFYDEGVGTDKFETIRGGAFGAGLMRNIGEAYRFLIFNHSPGDEIFIFGFSRGAYTARSFAGLLRCCGIPRRSAANRVNDAIKRYQGRKPNEKIDSDDWMEFRKTFCPHLCVNLAEDEWRRGKVDGYVEGKSPRLRVRYLGVWDTVGSLGIPARYRILDLKRDRYRFHNTELTDFVESARHALAIDERRLDFAPTPWTGLEALNKSVGADPKADDAPYQQRWFPGVHGSVGGGGDIRGLSDQALDWIWDGARRAGLDLDSAEDSPAYRLRPDHLAPLDNVSPEKAKSGLFNTILKLMPARDRSVCTPTELHELSVSALRRWLDPKGGEASFNAKGAVAGVKKVLAGMTPADVGIGTDTPLEPGQYVLHVVQRGDTLGGLARRYLGAAARWPEIQAANRYLVPNPDRIYLGQVLRIPIDPSPTVG